MESCRELIQQKPYDRSSIAPLEEFVASAIATEQYDFEIVKGLLKLYGVYPEETKTAVVANVLGLALMRLPSTDFLSLSCLVPGKLQNKETLKFIFTCADHLERCKFVEFWAVRNEEGVREILNNIKGFDQALRVFVLNSVQSVCRTVSQEKLQSMLGFSAAAAGEYTAFVKRINGAEVKDAVVSFASVAASGAAGTAQGQADGFVVKYENIIRHMELVQ